MTRARVKARSEDPNLEECFHDHLKVVCCLLNHEQYYAESEYLMEYNETAYNRGYYDYKNSS